jgi:hypothetical protein
MKTLKVYLLLIVMLMTTSTFAQDRETLISYIHGKMERIDSHYKSQFQNNLYPDEIILLTNLLESAWYLLAQRVPRVNTGPIVNHNEGLSKEELLDKLDGKMKRVVRFAYERGYIYKLNEVIPGTNPPIYKYSIQEVQNINETLKEAHLVIAKGKPAPPPVIVPPVQPPVVITPNPPGNNPPVQPPVEGCSPLIKVGDQVFSKSTQKILQVVYIDPACNATLIDPSSGFIDTTASLLNNDIVLISLDPMDSSADIIAQNCEGIRVGNHLSFKVKINRRNKRRRAIVKSILSDCNAELILKKPQEGIMNKNVTRLKNLRVTQER